MEKYKVVAILGKSAAGKDTIQNWLVNTDANIKKIVSCTTRPKRDYEEDGKDYYFISVEEFTYKLLEGSMLEAVSFKDNFYGSCLSELDKNKINIAVFELNGIYALLEDPRIDLMCIYIDVDDKVRLLRALKREQNPDCLKICERFLEENKVFADLSGFNYVVFNNSADLEEPYFPEVLKVIKDFGQRFEIE